MWRDLDALAREESGFDKALRLVLIVGLHALAIGAALSVAVQPELRQLAQQIQVRLIEMRPPEPPRVQPTPPKPLPQTPRPVIRPKPAPPPSVMTAAPDPLPTPTEFSMPPQPAPEPAPVVQQPPTPPSPVTPVRFDAEYLRNPKPGYPVMSRRLGEQGRVVLHVHVLADGTPARVELESSSGFPRLDRAALEAVARWRFLPSRRGDEPIDAWVLVPVSFALDR